MLLLCNEAAKRNVRKSISVPKENADGLLSKPLGLEYIADRVDTDDPIQGYLVRTRDEGWLQGFITVTTFTTWHREFEWNSLVQEAGISDEDKQNHRWDFDGSLAKELQKQKRVGDPHREGIVWKRYDASCLACNPDAKWSGWLRSRCLAPWAADRSCCNL